MAVCEGSGLPGDVVDHSRIQVAGQVDEQRPAAKSTASAVPGLGHSAVPGRNADVGCTDLPGHGRTVHRDELRGPRGQLYATLPARRLVGALHEDATVVVMKGLEAAAVLTVRVSDVPRTRENDEPAIKEPLGDCPPGSEFRRGYRTVPRVAQHPPQLRHQHHRSPSRRSPIRPGTSSAVCLSACRPG